MNEGMIKAWFQSKAVWGGIAAATAGAAGLLGHTIDANSQNAIADGAQQIASNALTIYTSAVSIIGGVAAIYGRIKANSTIGSK